jgi:hypothetical protein
MIDDDGAGGAKDAPRRGMTLSTGFTLCETAGVVTVEEVMDGPRAGICCNVEVDPDPDDAGVKCVL